MNVLFVGPNNATRGQLGEALGRHLAPQHGWASAGVSPTRVHIGVRAALAEEGVNPNGLIAKGVAAIAMEEIDVVIDLGCDLPRLPSRIRRLSWLIPDPSSAPAREREEAFRAARDELARRIRELCR